MRADLRTTDCHAIHGIIVHPEGARAPEWVAFDPDSLDALRRILGCQWIERVATPVPGVSMWVDEEGALSPDSAVNEHCSGILHRGLILGRALLTGITPIGEMVSITAQQHTALGSLGIVVPSRPGFRADLQWLSDEERQQLTSRVAARIQEGAAS